MMTTLPVSPADHYDPMRGRVGMLLLIFFEGIFFCTFVLAYLFYVGRSLTGPQPAEVLGLQLVIINSICLISSSGTIMIAERHLRHGRVASFGLWLAITIALGIEFIAGTAVEWRNLIFEDGLTIRTNLFGTTFYSLVGFHAAHVILGLTMLSTILVLTTRGHIRHEHHHRVGVVGMYWHFVDAVWIVVFLSVYVIGR